MVRLRRPRSADGHKRRLSAFTAQDRRGAYVHCGVREHVMGAMANGMAAHGGVIALAVTYLAFSDYERPAMRMAALMGLPVKFVFSHDSIGIGTQRPDAPAGGDPGFAARDAQHAGPAPGRCGRGGRVLGDRARTPQRPGRAWCSRARRCRTCAAAQPRPRTFAAAAPTCWPRRRAAPRRVTLLATGSEVALALQARDALQARGHRRPRWCRCPAGNCSRQQDDAYRTSRARRRARCASAVEAALRFGWDRWLGERGGFVGMTGFGASGPAEALYEHFGITADAIVARAVALHESAG